MRFRLKSGLKLKLKADGYLRKEIDVLAPTGIYSSEGLPQERPLQPALQCIPRFAHFPSCTIGPHRLLTLMLCRRECSLSDDPGTCSGLGISIVFSLES